VAALSNCSSPDCPNLTARGLCDEHRRAHRREVDRRRPTARARGYDTTWERTRRAFLACQPRCSEPGCWEPAVDVDHHDGLGPLGPRGHDLANLRGFCRPHHARRTARDQPGGWANR
jgi:5-methylcytosine-specific restriction protein A